MGVYRGHKPTMPHRQRVASSLRKLAADSQAAHPEVAAHQHYRDAASSLEAGDYETAQEHLRAAMFHMTPQSMHRLGIHDDNGHIAARQAMQGAHRHLLLVKGIERIHQRNEEHAEQMRAERGPVTGEHMPDPGALAQRPGARNPAAMNAPARTNAGKTGPDVAKPDSPEPRGSKQIAAAGSWDELAAVLELSADTARLASTPAPRGRPGGPGLYGVKGQKHSDYMEQVVKALIEKRGMPEGKAYAIARASLRKWGARSKHPEVRAAAGAAEAEESSKHGAHSHAVTWDDLAGVLDLASAGGHHVPGTGYDWRHTWIPLTESAARSHFGGKVPEGWSPGKGGGKLSAGSTEEKERGGSVESNPVRRANVERARTGVVKRGTRQNARIGGGLAVAGGTSDVNRPIAEALTEAVRTGREHYVIPTANGMASTSAKPLQGRYIKVTPDGSVSSWGKDLKSGQHLKSMDMPDEDVTKILDQHLSATRTREPEPPRTSAPKSAKPAGSQWSRKDIQRTIRDIRRIKSLQNSETYKKVRDAAAAAGALDLIPPEWGLAGDAPAIELGFNPAQPRVAAGSAAGGQFAPPGAAPASQKQTPAQQKAAKKAALLKQAKQDRQRAAALLRQIGQIQAKIRAAQKGTGKVRSTKTNVTKSAAPAKKGQAATTASAAQQAKTASAKAGGAAKGAAKAGAKTAKAQTVAQMRKQLVTLHAQVNALFAKANALSRQAAKL